MNESTGIACVALIWNVTKERFFLLQKNIFKKLTWFLLFIKSLFLFATILKSGVIYKYITAVSLVCLPDVLKTFLINFSDKLF